MKTFITLLLSVIACFFISQTKLFHEFAWYVQIIVGLFVYLFIILILSLTIKNDVKH